MSIVGARESLPPVLAHYDGSRDNNFTILRIALAWLVLWGHSYALTNQGVANPIQGMFRGSTWIGEIAVSGFFAISGYLVAASFIRRGWLDYTVSRALRIYPALLVCVLLTVFCLGPVVGRLGFSDYFSRDLTWTYLWNATAAFPMQFRLPGLFDQHLRSAANGSLWSLTVEVSCYLLLMLGGVAGLLRSRFLINLALACIALFAINYFSDIPLIGRFDKWIGPSAYFALGVAFYANRGSIPLAYSLALFSAALGYFSFGQPWFDYVFPPAFTYLVFFLAFRTPPLNVDHWLGDPSYGIYIYAWPVQQVVVHSFPSQGPYFNTALASVIVFVLAMCSWRFVEKPALGLKQRFLGRAKD